MKANTPVAVRLRPVALNDLPTFFTYQQDKLANDRVAFSVPDPDDYDAFMARWQRILANDAIVKRTILLHETVVGHITHFEQFGKPSVGYWIGRDYWGQGIATAALKLFLQQVPTRPLYARAAKDNLASIRVLQKCGFAIIGEDQGFAHARGTEIEEVILRL